MKISELITQLKAVQGLQGDMDVFAEVFIGEDEADGSDPDDYAVTSVDDVEVIPLETELGETAPAIPWALYLR